MAAARSVQFAIEIDRCILPIPGGRHKIPFVIFPFGESIPVMAGPCFQILELKTEGCVMIDRVLDIGDDEVEGNIARWRDSLKPVAIAPFFFPIERLKPK